nr:MAG TPA: hypothetical protein [Caudoviricetes sp.]
MEYILLDLIGVIKIIIFFSKEATDALLIDNFNFLLVFIYPESFSVYIHNESNNIPFDNPVPCIYIAPFCLDSGDIIIGLLYGIFKLDSYSVNFPSCIIYNCLESSIYIIPFFIFLLLAVSKLGYINPILDKAKYCSSEDISYSPKNDT